jgi:hypothetical protein
MPGAVEEISLKTIGEDKPVRTHIVDGLEVSSLHGNHCFSLEITPQSLIPVSISKDKIMTRTETVALPHRHSDSCITKKLKPWQQFTH